MQYIARQIHAEESFGTVGTCRKAATVKMTKKTWDCQSFMEVIALHGIMLAPPLFTACDCKQARSVPG